MTVHNTITVLLMDPNGDYSRGWSEWTPVSP
jgi:hypothetical protein